MRGKPKPDNSGALDDFEMFGIEEFSSSLADDGDGDFEVLPENWKTLGLFLAVQSQWNVASGMEGGSYTGLNYAAITPLVLRGVGISLKEWPGIFEGLRIMERTVLEEMNKRGK